MNNPFGPPFSVTLNSLNEANVTMPHKWATTLREKLRGYDISCEQSAVPAICGDEVAATLNFGTGANVTQIQQIIDSFTFPPLSVIMGS